MSLANIKGTNKDAKIYVGRSTTVHNLLFCAHTQCTSCIANTFLLVRSSVRSKQLLHFVLKAKAKKENKNIQQRALLSFISIYLLLTVE